MKVFILLTTLVASVMGQRGSFAGTGPKGVPELHARFRENNSDTNQVAQASIGNRLGEVDGTTARIPVDARGDVNLVNRLNEWPRENRPFWLTNYEIIEQQRGRPVGLPANSGSQQSGTTNILGNRFGAVDKNQPEIYANNSFTILMNGQMRTYVYNSLSDSWIRST